MIKEIPQCGRIPQGLHRVKRKGLVENLTVKVKNGHVLSGYEILKAFGCQFIDFFVVATPSCLLPIWGGAKLCSQNP